MRGIFGLVVVVGEGGGRDEKKGLLVFRGWRWGASILRYVIGFLRFLVLMFLFISG